MLTTMFRRAATVFALATLIVAFPAAPARAASTITNADFGTTGTASPAGWTTWSPNGMESADFTEASGVTGYHLTHWSDKPYIVSTWQTLTGLKNGIYTLRTWVRNGGGQNEVFVALRGCGGAEQRTSVPVTKGYDTWVQIATSVNVTNGQCTIILYSDAHAGEYVHFDDLSFAAGGAALPMRGGDLSGVKKNEDFGGAYYSENGTRGDPIQILKSHGMNYARLKVWVNPADGYNNKARVLEMSRRIKAAGMKLLIDFHYSDFWTDPGQQAKPVAWQGYNFTQLQQAVYDHTYDICRSLVAQGTAPDMVQVGNEINSGMLWEDGKNWTSAGWDNLAALLKQGIKGVKDSSPGTLIMLHNAEGGNNGHFRWWYDAAKARGVTWDVTGLSYYSYWHGTFTALQNNLNDMAARYGKPVVVVETSYPFTLADKDGWENVINDPATELTAGYPATPAGQAAMFRDVMSIVRAVPNGMGWGVFYWEPAWTGVKGSGWTPTDPSQGNAWENQALFDYSSRALPGMGVYAEAAQWVGSTTTLKAGVARGSLGGTVALRATLSADGAALAGRSVSFSLNGSAVGSATTDASGIATLDGVSVGGLVRGAYMRGVRASFDGDGAYTPSAAANVLVVGR
ncbi:arabinogalactan endo-1,4-beta-galactosidase [Chloroflexia bacterium SDU3-3]|nr:arabinogalactan endo-1,4-beta-galactosidase [Chloroflexia bacterium SDU3-3]